ncbi:MAG: MgtC/SapB family protein [Clostridia bacterium]|nr:MgtC/SapB family protein [Clostridia bacterium]
MEAFIDYMQSFNIVTVTVRLALALIVGGIIGLERGKQGRAAGMRTHILVSIGSALTAMIGFYLYDTLGVATDPMRIAAQVISGIGFLGVGTILIKGRFQITGLTTAAGLWATAAIGLALGAGFYTGALITFIFIVVTITILHRLEYRITKRYNRFGIYMEITSDSMVREAIDALQNAYSVSDIQITPPRSGKSENVGIEANVHIHGSERITPDDVARELEKLEYVVFAIESI